MDCFYTVSSILDGSMKSIDRSYASVLPARAAFLKNNSLEPSDTTLIQLTYETNDFCRYQVLSADDKGDGITRHATIEADALIVTEPNHALLLPLADCVGAVIHDPIRNILMVSHLGRHNLEQFGGIKCIQYLINNFDVNPNDLSVWLSPSAGKDGYPLHAFDNHSLSEVTLEQLKATGINEKNINSTTINTITDTNYYSHSEYLRGNQNTDGRFCIVALMR